MFDYERFAARVASRTSWDGDCISTSPLKWDDEKSFTPSLQGFSSPSKSCDGHGTPVNGRNGSSGATLTAMQQQLASFQEETRSTLVNLSAKVDLLHSEFANSFAQIQSDTDLHRRSTMTCVQHEAATATGVRTCLPDITSSMENILEDKLAKQLQNMAKVMTMENILEDKLAKQLEHMLNMMNEQREAVVDHLNQFRAALSDSSSFSPRSGSKNHGSPKHGHGHAHKRQSLSRTKSASELILMEDPRRTIARFLDDGDSRGPAGILEDEGVTPDATNGTSSWFAVFRPCTSDAIRKMCMGDGSGKGLNVKGKSAKEGPLSGYVPFLQISDNLHRKQLSTPSRSSRFQIFYRSSDDREEARECLQHIMNNMIANVKEANQKLAEFKAGVCQLNDAEEAEMYERLEHEMDDPTMQDLNENINVFGLDLPERLFREAYITRQDLTTPLGWETGRKSEPAFCNMNINCLRESMNHRNMNLPHTVLLQYEEENVMNPHSLVMAYVQEGCEVKPVVSDFDAFLIGSRGMNLSAYPLPPDQVELVKWCLDGTRNILEHPSTQSWSSRWLQHLKAESAKGFHPDIPPSGFGDPLSTKIIEGLIKVTHGTGAVRHGPECFNFYFPQELDAEYLIIWKGFGGSRPWAYMGDPQLRGFLMERINDGYSFPLNPAWLVRDKGWYEVLKALRQSADGERAIVAWFPPGSDILETADQLHEAHPHGFQQTGRGSSKQKVSLFKDGEPENGCEAADLGLEELRRYEILRRAKRKLKLLLMTSRQIRKQT